MTELPPDGAGYQNQRLPATLILAVPSLAYHVLARYPVEAFVTSLAGKPIDIADAGSHLAALIHAEHPSAAAA